MLRKTMQESGQSGFGKLSKAGATAMGLDKKADEIG
jgi:hypothetical protein